MRRLFATLKRLESSLASVLLLGESGVGKELVARALHDGSSVSDGPFVAKNCATLSRELAQSELFGHRRGAFTGALESRVGAFEAAQGGTLFLDEVGELPLEVQPILLRVLESAEVTPLGSNDVRPVRVRVIAATNRPLDESPLASAFREDLFYRLAVVTLRVPSLRERAEDIPALVRHVARQRGIAPLPESVVQRFRERRWPGNVRELRNAVEAYAALGQLPEAARTDRERTAGALGAAIDLERPLQEQRSAIVAEFTRAYLERLLEVTGGNQSRAARIAGIERSYLRRLLSQHGLLPSDR